MLVPFYWPHPVADSKRGMEAAPPLLAHNFFKAAFFRVKGIYFVVRICDK